MPNQNKRTSFTPRVSKGSAEKRRMTGKPPEAHFNPILMKRKSLEEIRQTLGLT